MTKSKRPTRRKIITIPKPIILSELEFKRIKKELGLSTVPDKEVARMVKKSLRNIISEGQESEGYY